VSTLALQGCDNASNPNEYPVSHWRNDSDECTRASVAAIVKAGLPFPNFGIEEVPGGANGAPPKRRITTVDMWLADVRFVIPAKIASIDGYPEHHPRRYQGLHGSLPHFYPPGPPAPEIDGMGSRVDVKFVCSMDPKYAASWGKGYRSHEERIAAVKAQYEEELRQTPQFPGTVTVNRRDDIGMTEVLLDRHREGKGQRWWEASYWPIDSEMKGLDGSVSGIRCEIRHDPVDRRYGHRGWSCRSGMRLTPQGGAQIEIYVTHIQQMPVVFEQVKQLLINAKQPSRK
jgi:hypothetical protein